VSKIKKWGREESLLWPPRGFHYTHAAILIALLAAGFLMSLRFHFGLSPLEKYYLPYYLRTATVGIIHPTGAYQLVFVSAWTHAPASGKGSAFPTLGRGA
jgi:hypothetical protein